ncbi:MAG: hypothetical protein ACM3JG_00565 [Thiohalocapsa sp.]
MCEFYQSALLLFVPPLPRTKMRNGVCGFLNLVGEIGMPRPNCLRRWVALPGRLALLLGIGALAVPGGQAGAVSTSGDAAPLRVPQQSVADFGVLHVWTDDGGRIYLSEAGGKSQELRLGDTEEARVLRELLARDGATAARPQALPHRIILVGGGGDGVPPPAHSSASRRPGSNGGDATAKEPAASPQNPESTGDRGPTPPSAAQKG